MNDNFKIPTKANLSKLDEMIAFLIDNVTLNEAITVVDLLGGGFSHDEICEHAGQAAKIARRKFVRQINSGYPTSTPPEGEVA